MNKYEKATYDFKAVKEVINESHHTHKEIALELVKSLEKRHLKLVERATPKKAIYNNLCPQCNLLLNSDYKNNGHLLYCPRCGQALYRSDKE